MYGWCAKNKKKDGTNYNIYTDGLEKLHATIKQYHSSNMPDAISYAYGYSYSMNYKDCTLRNLLDKADHEMYLNKQAQKKKR